MHPIEQMLMAARGHQGLPMELDGPQEGMPSAPIGGPPPSPGGPLPAGPPAPSAGAGDDREVAATAAQHLLEATQQADDPALKAAFSQALAVLHKYIVGHDNEKHQALTGKLSPRLMAQAHGRSS